eukprot:TRINITY_DN1319_c1_g2_i3.p1 TRINITY_DN1319_c1_g2~~TRINITY_DN1319_c1_g2_i3.p1  ORF type:complete len:715 (+),score=215.67 TRINITY_DN1319_c1_g2_i3:93-2147(+)
MADSSKSTAAKILAVLGALWLVLWQLTFKKEKGKSRAGVAPLAPSGSAAEPHQQAQWWWLEWHMGHLRKAGRRVRAAVVGGRLGAADAAAWREFFAAPGLDVYAADAEPGAGAIRLNGSCAAESSMQGIVQQLAPGADVVVDLGDSPDPSEQQVVRWRSCFAPLLRPGGIWVVEHAGKAYGDPGAPLDANSSMIAVGRIAVDQINRRNWDRGEGEWSVKTTILFPGVQHVQTVLFAENTVILSRKGRWGDTWDQMIYLLGTWCLLPPPSVKTRHVDSVSGDHGQPPSYLYRAGGPTWGGQQYSNPACAVDEPGPGDNASAACAAAAERATAAAEAGQGMPEVPTLGSNYSEPIMDGMSKSDKLGGSHFERVNTGHGYDRWYQWFFDPVRDRKLQMLEVGLATGESSIMWSKYFKNAKLIGMDYVFDIPEEEPVRKDGVITLFLGDQGNPEHLKRMVKTFGEASMDLIVDDGGHIGSAQIQTFKVLFRDLLRPGGTFVIEDIEGSYLGRHVMYSNMLYGGLQKRGTLIEVSKLFVDTVNRPYWSATGHRCVLETGADAMIETIFFAENYVAFTKKGRPRKSPQPPTTPPPKAPPPPRPPRAPQQGREPAPLMSERSWDGSWYIPRPQCNATMSGHYPGWLPAAPLRKHTRGRPQCVDPQVLLSHGGKRRVRGAQAAALLGRRSRR